MVVFSCSRSSIELDDEACCVDGLVLLVVSPYILLIRHEEFFPAFSPLGPDLTIMVKAHHEHRDTFFARVHMWVLESPCNVGPDIVHTVRRHYWVGRKVFTNPGRGYV